MYYIFPTRHILQVYFMYIERTLPYTHTHIVFLHRNWNPVLCWHLRSLAMQCAHVGYAIRACIL